MQLTLLPFALSPEHPYLSAFVACVFLVRVAWAGGFTPARRGYRQRWQQGSGYRYGGSSGVLSVCALGALILWDLLPLYGAIGLCYILLQGFAMGLLFPGGLGVHGSLRLMVFLSVAIPLAIAVSAEMKRRNAPRGSGSVLP